MLETPKAHLHATGIFGALIDRTVQLPEILPGQSIDFSQVWKNMPPFEIGTLHLDVTDASAAPPGDIDGGALADPDSPCSRCSLWYLAVLALLVGLVFRRRRTSPPPVRARREPTRAAAP